MGHPTILGRDKEVAELNLDKFDFQTSLRDSKGATNSRADTLAPGFWRPALKRGIEVEFFSATLKRCSPLLKQGAPTTEADARLLTKRCCITSDM